MGKICVQNLQILITKKCNLNCNHCMRGKQENTSINHEIIDSILNQLINIGTLTIGGGEPLLEIEKIKYIFDYIIKSNIIVEDYGIITNGTIYSEEIIKLFDYMDSYIKRLNDTPDTSYGKLYISYDIFHKTELERLNILKQVLENIEKYSESKYFAGLKGIHGKLFREGNAINLPNRLTIPFRPMKISMTYVGDDKKLDIKNGLCNIGPLITVNPDGIVTEDVSWDSQNTTFNYGNILEDSIEEIFKKRKVKVLEPDKWYKKQGKEIQKYYNYKH